MCFDLARQETGFKASERNRDASHASAACELTLDAPRTIRMAVCRPGASFPKSIFENKTERRGEERENRKRRKEEKGERKEATPVNSYPAWSECSVFQRSSALLAGRYTRNMAVFISFHDSRFSCVGGAFVLLLLLLLLSILLTSVTKYTQDAF